MAKKTVVSLVREEEPAQYVVTPTKYRMDESLGLPGPLGVLDTPEMEFGAGNVRGAALGADLVEWFEDFQKAQTDKGVTDRYQSHDEAAEFIRARLDDIYKILLLEPHNINRSRRGQAIGLLQSLSTLVVTALADSQNAKADTQRLLNIELEAMREDADKAASDALDLMRR